MALTGYSVSGKVAGKITKTHADGSQQFDDFSFPILLTPSDADLLFHNQYSIAGSGSQNIDLSGALTDAVGQSCVFSKVYAVMIYVTTATPGTIVNIGNSNFLTWLGATGDLVKLGPTGLLILANTIDGYAVTASTGDILTIANPGGSGVTVKVAILGKA